LLWMHGNELTHGDPLYPIHFIDDFHRQWFRDGVATWGNVFYRLQNLFFWPGAALATLSPLVGAFGLAGMAVAFRRQKSVRWLLWIAWLPAAYFTVRGTVFGSFVPL